MVYAGNRSTKAINISCDSVSKLGIYSQKPQWGISPQNFRIRILKTRFFLKIWCAILEVFRPAGATHLTAGCQWNLARRKGLKAICYVDDTSLRRNARPVLHWLLANAYCVSSFNFRLNLFSESFAHLLAIYIYTYLPISADLGPTSIFIKTASVIVLRVYLLFLLFQMLSFTAVTSWWGMIVVPVHRGSVMHRIITYDSDSDVMTQRNLHDVTWLTWHASRRAFPRHYHTFYVVQFE